MRFNLHRCLMLLLPLSMALGARGQTPIVTETFATDGENTVGQFDHRYTSTSAALNSELAFTANHYFMRATDNAPKWPNTTGAVVFGTSTTPLTIYDPGTTTPAAPGFWVGEGVRNTTNSTTGQTASEGLVELNPVNVTNYNSLQVSVKLADPRATGTTSVADLDDVIRIEYKMGTGSWTTVGMFKGTATNTYWQATNPATQAPIAGGAKLARAFQTFTYNINDVGSSLQVRVAVDHRGGSEEMAFDDLTVLGTVSAVTPPALANIETSDASYTEAQASPVQITNAITVGYSTNLTGATVQISSGFRSGQDLLNFTTQNSISGVYTPSTGVLALSGSASAANYQTALRSITYSNSNMTTAAGGRRTVRFNVADGSNSSAAQSRDVVVTAILAGPAAMPYTEEFTSDGEGTRYATNSFNTAGTNAGGLGWFRTNVNPLPDYTTATFSNINNYYWYGEGTNNVTNPDAVKIGYLETQTIDASSYINLHYQVRLGTGKAAQYEADDYLKLYYRVAGGNWTLFATFAGNASNELQTTDASTGTVVLGNALVDVDFALPATVTGIVDFRTELSNDGEEELAMDLIQVTGTQVVAPTVTTAAATTITINSAVLGGNVTAEGGVGVTTRGVVYSSTNNTPAVGGSGVTLNDNGSGIGAFSETIAGLTPGTTYYVRAYATNSVGTSYGVVQQFATSTITVSPTTLPSGTVAAAYSQTITASGGTAPYSYAITAGALPAGLSLSSAGVVAGTPTAGGSFTFTVTATDASTGGGPYTAARSYTLTISAPTITVSPATLPAGTVAAAYSQTVTASGGTAPYSYAITAGALPAGLSLSSAGVVAGTPTAGGSFTFTVTATDASTGSGPYSGSRSYTLTIAAPTVAVGPATLPNGAVGTAYSQTITASGGTAPYSYAVTTGTLPTGLSLSAAGVLAGTPTAGGPFTFTVTATDASTGSGPYSGSRSYTVTITSATTVVSVTRLLPSPTATAQVRYQVVFSTSVTGVSISNFGLTFSGISGPSFVSLSGSGTTYIVTFGTGTGNGTMRLNVANSSGITPAVTNVPYTSGEVYSIIKNFAAAPQLILRGAGSATGLGDVAAFVDVVQVLQGGTAFTAGLSNSGFETNNVAANSFRYASTVVAAPWSFSGNSGVSRNGVSGFGSTAAQGDAVGLLQTSGGTGGSIAQNLAVPTGSYQVGFQAVQRANNGTSDQVVNVFLNNGTNDVFIGTSQPASNSTYQSFTSATFNVTAPAVTTTISSSAGATGSTTSTAPIPFTVTFSQSVTGFVAGDVTVGNGTISGFTAVSGTVYTFNVTPTANGAVTVNVPASSAVDANNTGNSAATQFSITYSQAVTAAPVVTAPAHVSLTNDNTPTYVGTAPANSTVTVYVDGSSIGTTTATGGNWTLTQPTALTDGTHTVNATAQASGEAVSATSNTNGFTVDATAPSVSITSTASSPTATSPIPVTVTFSEVVTGFAASDVLVGNGSVSNFSGSGSTYTFSVTPTASGVVTVDVPASAANDAAGNGNTAATQFSIQYNQPTTAAPVITLPADNTFTNQAVTISGTAPANSDVVLYVSQNGGPFGPSTFNTTAGGTFSTGALPFPEATYQVYGTAQSPGAAVSTNSATITFTVDTTAPTVALTSTTGASGSSTSTSPFAYTATFSESVTGFVGGDLNVTNGTVSNFSGSGTTYTFNVTPTTAGTATTVAVFGNSSQDAAGNGNSVSNTYSLTYNAPTATAWNGSVSTDWFTAGNWTPAVVPTLTISATIPTSATQMPTIGTGTATALAVTIDAGATLSMSGGTLQANGNWTNNGTFTATGGTVQLGGTNGRQILGSSNTRFWNLTTAGNTVTLATSAGINIQRLITTNVALANGNNLVLLESNASGTAMAVNPNTTGVNGAGSMVQRYISPDLNPGAGYRHLASPTVSLSATQGAMFGDLATASYTPVVNAAYNTAATPATVTPFPNIFGYDQSRLASATNNLDAFSKGWVSPSALTDRMTSGYGYTVNLAAGQTVTFKGGLGYGNLAKTLTRNATGTTNAADAGWNLMGNPYPSPLDYSLVLPADRSNVEAAIYVYESTSQYGGQYQAYVNGVGGNPVLAMGQAFFARVASGQTSGTITFRNNQRLTTYQNPVYHRTSTTRPLVQLDLQGANSADPMYVYFEQGATAGTDAEFDAVKLPNTTGLNLSAVAGNDEMSINGLPTLGAANVTVPLQVRVPATGTYTLHAAQIVNLPAGMIAYLRDRQTGAVVDLSLQPDYMFQLNAAYTGVRFELFFTPQRVLSVAPASLSAQVALYPNPAHKAVFVELPATLTSSAVTVTLVDALGRSVLTQKLATGMTTQQISLENVAAGVYAVRLQTAQGTVTKKLTVE